MSVSGFFAIHIFPLVALYYSYDISCITGVTHNFLQVGNDTVLTVGRDGKTYYDPIHGITLHIPNDSLPLDIEEITVTIKVGFTDHNFSDGMITCSATVSLQCSPHVLFTKDVFLEVPHSVSSLNTSDLCFVKLKDDTCKTEVYNGIFPLYHPYGVIMTDSFSSYVIVKGKRFFYSRSLLRKSYLSRHKWSFCKLLSVKQSKQHGVIKLKDQFNLNLFWFGIKKISSNNGDTNTFSFMVTQYTPTGFYVS